jgi:hypothetical protein
MIAMMHVDLSVEEGGLGVFLSVIAWITWFKSEKQSETAPG